MGSRNSDNKAAGKGRTRGAHAARGPAAARPPTPAPAPAVDPFADSRTVAPTAAKILIAGGFGVGKTTMVTAVSEVPPVRTEEYLTRASMGVDDLRGLPQKNTTTVALDFGRITVDSELVIYLFGTPGQERFWFMWDDLLSGALGAVVLVDTRRIDVSFASIDFFESRGIPFVVGVNLFHGRRERGMEEIREALDLDPGVPLLLRDVRRREDCRELLLALVDLLMKRALAAEAVAGAERSVAESTR